jgi:hypothetical protein
VKRGDGFGCDPVIVLFVMLAGSVIAGLLRAGGII